MRIFNVYKAGSKAGSHLALAIALATGTAVVGTLGFADPAHAQRKKDKEDERPKFSKEFVEAYQALEPQVNAEGADLAALKPQIMQLSTLAQSPDELNAAGGMVYNAGARSGDQQLQYQGIQMLLDSGKVAPENLGRYSFIAYQLANGFQDYPKARKYLQGAIDNNFTAENITVEAMQINMAENFWSEGLIDEGLDYMDGLIAQRKAAGQEVPQIWYTRSLTVAYDNEVTPRVYDIALAWIADYPSPDHWRDAINRARNLNNFEDPELLDLLRLGRRVGALQDKQDYLFYIDAADPRRLPKEVKDVIEAGYASGAIDRSDSWIAEQLTTANSRIATDRADLPALERDANAASAGVRTVIAAGDAFLSYDEFAKAEGFYRKSLDMAGVDRPQALTRLGIAQAEQGKIDEAKATFAQVDGARMPIAKLWTAYAETQATPSAATATPAAATDEAETTVGG